MPEDVTTTTETVATTVASGTTPAGVPPGTVRSYAVIALVFVVAYLAMRQIDIPSEIKDLTLMALSYYYGSRDSR